MSASGRFMHLWCVSCGGAAVFCYVVARGRVVALAGLVVLGAAEPLVRLKVRGERLKAGSFYRFALNHGLVYSVECKV